MSRTVPIVIDDDHESGQGERVVTLELMYDGPSDLVKIGGDGLYASLEVTIIDDDDDDESKFDPLYQNKPSTSTQCMATKA